MTGRWGRWKTLLARAVLILVALAVAIQFVPYGRAHTNPPVTATTTWDSPRTEQLFTIACADCHSNLTRWPWYTNVAPVSWLVQHDVDSGRRKMNVSDAGRGVPIDEIARVLREGEMPPLQYTIKHRDAALSADDRAALIAGMRTTFAARLERGREDHAGG